MQYRRDRSPGSSYFFTVVTYNRRPILCEPENNFPFQQKKGFSQFYILYEGQPQLITLPNNNAESLGGYIAVHKDLLLVGSPSNRTGGSGLLFNLKALDNVPIELTIDNAHIGDTVAIS